MVLHTPSQIRSIILVKKISNTKFQKLVSELCEYIDRSPKKNRIEISVFCDWIQKSSTQLNLILSREQYLLDYLLCSLIDRLDYSLLEKKETAINDVLIALLKAYKDSNSQIEFSHITGYTVYQFTMVFSKIASSTNFATYYVALEFLLDINQNSQNSQNRTSNKVETLYDGLPEIITKFTEEQVDALVDLLNMYGINDINNRILHSDSISRRLFESLAKLIDSKVFDSEYSKLKKLLKMNLPIFLVC